MKKIDVEELINDISKLHAPQLIFSDVYCSHCLETMNYETDQAPYPCATIQIIDKHLGETR